MISVVIPTYNHASSLVRCLNSVLAQRDVDLDVIIVDDGSTDTTQEALFPYANDAHVRMVRQDNRGSNNARNAGARLARGAFLIFVDADAVLLPTMLCTLQHALQQNTNSAYAYSDFRYSWKRFRAGAFSETRLKTMNFIHTSALMRREAFEEFDESIRRFQDWDLWLTLLAHGNVGVYVPQMLFAISVERAGISSWLPKMSYHAPWRWFPGIRARVRSYEDAREVIRRKHHL
ncbi:glycosyltransferase family 2 protein [Candidatus Uhrbacteria bacterium]|nr:glycosyltransferase family 2 protein [Candidatus Uhrbacteria bacterium]